MAMGLPLTTKPTPLGGCLDLPTFYLVHLYYRDAKSLYLAT